MITNKRLYEHQKKMAKVDSLFMQLYHEWVAKQHDVRPCIGQLIQVISPYLSQEQLNHFIQAADPMAEMMDQHEGSCWVVSLTGKSAKELNLVRLGIQPEFEDMYLRAEFSLCRRKEGFVPSQDRFAVERTLVILAGPIKF